MKTGRTLEWDPVRGEVKGDEEVNRQYLAREYRGPWKHPEAKGVESRALTARLPID